jgi:hypothetical protein
MISKMIGELKDENREQHQSVTERIKILESKVEEIAEVPLDYDWNCGCGVFCSFTIFNGCRYLTPDQPSSRIERIK